MRAGQLQSSDDKLEFKASGRAVSHQIEAPPDLLAVEPTLAVDAADLCASLDFAFAGGSCIETLKNAMDGVAVADSSWSPECFVADLYVDELVERCMQVTVKGWRAELNRGFIARVLCAPPRSLEVVAFRREVLTTLDDDDLRPRFAQLYRDLCQLRTLFGDMTSSSRYETNQRRIDTLSLFRDIIKRCATFRRTGADGLDRIGAYADEVMASDGHARLVELLDYDSDMARVDVRLQLGADGRVRKLELLSLSEDDQNQFYASPLGRFLAPLVFWWRGYRFSRDELVDRWLDLVFQGVSQFLPPLFQLLGHMEIYLASLALRDRCESHGLPVCFAELVDDGGLVLEELFNPLLFAQDVVPTPCTITSDSFETIHILTGPNSGGKTRLLQAIGIAQLLGQAGLYVPAKVARLRPATGLFVSLINEQSAVQKEGRLGTELMRIRQLFEVARSGSLVIIDELCSGTNPSEGEEIFYLVLTLLHELHPEAFITTHFLEFARRLNADEEPLPLAFLQVELDSHQRPTYAFIPGVATTSLAAQTAARLGVTREELMALVRRNKR